MNASSTLRRRMIISLGLMALGSLAMGVGAMIAVNGLHQDMGSAVQGYQQLRQLFSAGFFASRARDAMAASPPQPQQAITALQAALAGLDAPSDCRDLLSEAIYEIDHGQQNPPSLNLLFGRLLKLSIQVRQSILDAQSAADQKRNITLWAIIALCIFVVMAAIAIGVGQYRRVIGPINKIGDGVRTFAKGKFDQRIIMTGDLEFVSLVSDFNQMADELSTLYQNLEQKVQAQSKELIRAERLASVGYLASGVAHEINNPLGIIAGYGERSLQQLSAGLNDATLPATQKALQIICEEAFRCKQITDRLLSLARPGSETRQAISIATLAEAIVSTLSGLGTVGERSLKIIYGSKQDLYAMIHEGEMKQVLLNLILNSLEAVDAKSGQVSVAIERERDQLQISVTDNGQGMTADTLDRIFQPFFTQKRDRRPGTGLGLSIAHSIVTDHGGRIWAQSPGLNLGSTFTIQLPALRTEVGHDHA